MKPVRAIVSGVASVAVNGLLVVGLAAAGGLGQDEDPSRRTDSVRVVPRPPPPEPEPEPPAPDAPPDRPRQASMAPPVEASPVQGNLQGLAVPETDPDLYDWEARGQLPSFVSGEAMSQEMGRAMEVEPAQLLVQPNLDRFYPRRAEIDRIEGHTDILIRIDARGRPEEVTVIDSQPPGVFEEAARAAGRQFRLRPARRGGRPEPSQKVFRLEWSLPEDGP